MKFRAKIIAVVFPIISVSVLLVGASSFFLASAGINRLARDFLGFKVAELEKYALSQYQLLVENDLQRSDDYIQATKGSIGVYADSIIRSDTELIFAVDPQGRLQMTSGELLLTEGDSQRLADIYGTEDNALFEITIAGVPRVAKGFVFEPFQWFLLVTESRATFFQDINQITTRTIYLLIASLVLTSVILYTVTTRLIRPLNTVVDTMRDIITTSDLSKKVPVEYDDETGALAHTFNIMTGELDRAYTEIKRFARDAALAEHKEKKVRQIFQKYVPQELIDRFFQSPESMLVGEDRVLAILFSDIRSFTTISESMHPSELVNQLNTYFTMMVDIIMDHQGIVDKYIGDAIMAIFGAPVKHDDDAYQSVSAGLDMVEAMRSFNAKQQAKGYPPFLTGIGINYGIVTVGNIGAEKKMDYTVIGDMVNLASRLEGLTKEYRQDLIISESLQRKISENFPTRLLDTVAVKGKKRGIRIYGVERELDSATERAWNLHHRAMDAYYAQDFSQAIEGFESVRSVLPEDHIAVEMIQRCRDFQKDPPPDQWDGVKIMKTK